LEVNASAQPGDLLIRVERAVNLMKYRIEQMRQVNFFFMAAFILMITLPYIYGYLAAGSDYVFVGFLLNPLDGNSYLAKMYQGWSGEWQFTLPYTAQKGEGTYLFLFYLFLGHAARWLNLSLITVFHLARVIGAITLLAALTAFGNSLFCQQPRTGTKAVLLAAFGSGIGWLAISTGQFTSDFWVAEAYPYLSAFATPHFGFGLALLLTIFLFSQRATSLLNSIFLFSLSVLLSIIQPFGVAIAAAVIGSTFALESWQKRQLKWKPLLPVIIGGGIPLIYQYWAILNEPLLSGWNAQNITGAPPLWDLLLSLSPALLLAIYAIAKKWNTGSSSDFRLPVVWLVVGLLMIFFPFNLQRRFMLGIYVPTAMLAVFGLMHLEGKWFFRSWAALFGISVLTNLIILSASLFGISKHDPALYLTRGEHQALGWIQMETDADAVILSSPEMGRFIPALTGRRVIYGHPFETVNAAEQERRASAFFTDQIMSAGISVDLGLSEVDYVFFGPRERSIGTVPLDADISPIYQNAEVVIFEFGGK
jgi:hypothetical protein